MNTDKKNLKKQRNNSRLLLTSVFGPYGVNDEYGEKTNKMELFHNQVTREQGIFSYRFNHNSFGLYFLAENINVPSTVLDFPSLEDFKQEISKGYEYIGISFIIPNLKKAQKMTQLIREISPESKIILGGHGTNTPNVENLLEYDYISRGEGISFMREIFNEDIDAPINHPLVKGSCNRKIMGVKLPLNTGMVVTGVGCANKCAFCATSHFFREYTAYLPTGKDIFDLCCRYEDEMGVSDFSIMDENFLKMKDRALELISLMEENQRYFTFSIFSSAETMKKLGDLDLLIRLGVQFIWIGIESKEVIFEKNRDTDFNT
ncbi:MAG: radical SAM protein, partial [Deltaproteobacteria bacterium]|nr:radical SAM protein [Deltaproteobacteria bacterium]